MKNLSFSFDIGYASIGWSVMEYEKFDSPTVVGTGVVLFGADSCLASKRREFRRMRRTIRSRRKRIERIGAILQHYGIITEAERHSPGHPAPFFLAAQALQGLHKLTGLEIWHILRWYAHNRGYNGNALWKRDADPEDTKRETAAKELMTKMGTNTMAETIVAMLGLNTEQSGAGFTVNTPKYKGQTYAFPRDIVECEVRTILTHSSLTPEITELILGDVADYRQSLLNCGIKYPLRYKGSTLFGQLLPRFDNRIIARCPITWATTYRQALNEGKDEAQAKKLADKYAKVPNANTPEFYDYRFARILANIRIDGKPLDASTRQELMKQAHQVGRFTKTEFIKLVESLHPGKTHNLRSYFELVPDAEKALVIVPSEKKLQTTGRAPYARPIMRQVTEEILRGEDATKPALSIEHPDGEPKAKDGILYCLLNPESEVAKIQANRTIEQQTNNHLVRHRMLIFERLLNDMVNKYANGSPYLVTHFCIEVGRELREFSGKTNKEIASILNEKHKHFNAAVKKLQTDAPHLQITGGLIRKCRIAMDMGWKCPYTGHSYGAADLPQLEREHIIPHASRNTNALSALVLTWREVNDMKGKRTGLEFIRDCGGQPVPGRENLSILTESRYKKLVEGLKAAGSPDDKLRIKKRSKLLLVDTTPKKGELTELGFTEGQMTQSSQLMRLAAQVAGRKLKHARMIAIPGQITAETRKSWKLQKEALARVCPEIIDPVTNQCREKGEIRSITHLHHAVDAATLGLILHLIPGGSNGGIWQMLLKRKLNEADLAKLHELGSMSSFMLDASMRMHLKPIPFDISESLIQALEERRVIYHIPADMSGAMLDTQYKRLIESDDKLYLKNRAQEENNAKQRKKERKALKEVKPNKVIGLLSSKLKSIKAALVINENYGIALDPEPTIIRHAGVYKALNKLHKDNHYKPVRILRTGMLISITKHKDSKRNRQWRIASVKENAYGPALDLQHPDAAISAKDKAPQNWREASLKSLINSGLVIHEKSYIG